MNKYWTFGRKKAVSIFNPRNPPYQGDFKKQCVSRKK